MILNIERKTKELQDLVTQLMEVRRKAPSEAVRVVEVELRKKALGTISSLQRDVRILKFAASGLKAMLLIPVRVHNGLPHLMRLFDLSHHSGRAPEHLVAPLLAIRWLFTKPNREHLELIASDLAKDIRAMRDEHRSEFYVRWVVCCRTASALFDVSWDGLKRLVGALLFLASVLRRLGRSE